MEALSYSTESRKLQFSRNSNFKKSSIFEDAKKKKCYSHLSKNISNSTQYCSFKEKRGKAPGSFQENAPPVFPHDSQGQLGWGFCSESTWYPIHLLMFSISYNLIHTYVSREIILFFNTNW